jgi:hypothetical protein
MYISAGGKGAAPKIKGGAPNIKGKTKNIQGSVRIASCSVSRIYTSNFFYLYMALNFRVLENYFSSTWNFIFEYLKFFFQVLEIFLSSTRNFDALRREMYGRSKSGFFQRVTGKKLLTEIQGKPPPADFYAPFLPESNG